MIAVCSQGAAGQAAVDPEPANPAIIAPAPQATSTGVILPANSAIPVRFLTTVSSGTHVRGQRFELETTDDITAADRVVIPAGSVVTGEVIHAQKAGMLGKPGELILAARFVTVGAREIKLRSQLMRTGKDNTMAALMIVPFIKGKDLVVPAQTEVIARTVTDEVFDK